MTGPTVAGALAGAKRLGVERLDAQLLLAHTLARPRSWLLAHDDQSLGPAPAAAFGELLRRRGEGEPLAYLVGTKDFYGLTLKVNAHVLIPRPETEVLVGWAIELIDALSAQVNAPRVLDLGTGSGAIAIVLKHERPAAEVAAVDISEGALATARDNAKRLGAAVAFQQGDWLNGRVGPRYHLIVSNPPYIEPDDPHLAALKHEPALALTPGTTGLAALATISASAADHLEPGAWLLFEHGHDQAPAVQAMLLQAGFDSPQTRLDLAGHSRCTGARKP